MRNRAKKQTIRAMTVVHRYLLRSVSNALKVVTIGAMRQSIALWCVIGGRRLSYHARCLRIDEGAPEDDEGASEQSCLQRLIRGHKHQGQHKKKNEMSKKVDVPAELPAMLKNYTKAVIRTQPEDLLKW